MALVTHRHRHFKDIYVFVTLEEKKRQDLERKINRFLFINNKPWTYT